MLHKIITATTDDFCYQYLLKFYCKNIDQEIRRHPDFVSPDEIKFSSKKFRVNLLVMYKVLLYNYPLKQLEHKLSFHILGLFKINLNLICE